MIDDQTLKAQLEKLKNHISWASRLSTALGSTQNVDDLISIVLSALVAPISLGYSRVLYFDFDRTHQLLKGRYALFHESKESFENLRCELEDEIQYLKEWSGSATDSTKLDYEELLESLESNVPWIVLFQRLSPENEVTEHLKSIEIQVTSTSEEKGKGNLFHQVSNWRKPRAFSCESLGDRLPRSLQGILSGHFAIVPLCTHSGLRAMMIVDRHLEDCTEISEEDLVELDSFSRQAAIAIENGDIYRDLSGAFDELKQLDQMKTNFLSVISHELRTPLTALSGFADLILDERVGGINSNQRMLLGRMKKNTAHLTHLVNDLIEVAEVEAEGSLDVGLKSVEPLVVLMDTLPKLEQRRRENDVEVIPVIDGNIPCVCSDERSLGRILFHLLDNALKFSKTGSTVEVHFRTTDDEKLSIDIVDHGMGIAPENLENIFRQFYQVDNTLTREHEGLGLGLAVTRMLIQSTHGHVDVQSEVAQGSTFTITYPIYNKHKGIKG
jgi:signal transduction histidine kinase